MTVAVDLEGLSEDMVPRACDTTRHFAALFVTRVQVNASGRPGPNVVTGNYRRSWHWRMEDPTVPEAVCGTNAPQARRLEWGFDGVDSLGRHYHQPPYPHVEPALAETAPEYVAAIEAIVGDQ